MNTNDTDINNYIGWFKTCGKCKIEKPKDQFSVNNTRKGGLSHECKACHKKYRKDYYINNHAKELERITKRKQKLKEWLKQYKSEVKCNRCPENHIAVIDFHHMDVRKKELNISLVVRRGWSVKRIMKEIEKCEVLCSNCHRKLHFNNAGLV